VVLHLVPKVCSALVHGVHIAGIPAMLAFRLPVQLPATACQVALQVALSQ